MERTRYRRRDVGCGLRRPRKWEGGGRPRRHAPVRAAGQALTEFALVLPILIVIFMGVLDLGRAFHTLVAASNAARVGLIYAQQIIDPTKVSGTCSASECAIIRVSDVITKTVNEAQGGIPITPSNVSVCVATNPCVSGGSAGAGGATFGNEEAVTITVTVPFTPITPFVHLHAVSGSVTGRTFPS